MLDMHKFTVNFMNARVQFIAPPCLSLSDLLVNAVNFA